MKPKGSSAGSKYASRGGGDEGEEYADGVGGGGYALPLMHGGEGVSGMCSGGPGIIITGGQDGSAAVWRWGNTRDKSKNNSSAGELIHRWDAHPKPVTRVAHLPDADRVLTACRDGLVRAWSPGDTATPTTEFKGHTLTVSGLAALEVGDEEEMMHEHSCKTTPVISYHTSAPSHPPLIRPRVHRHLSLVLFFFFFFCKRRISSSLEALVAACPFLLRRPPTPLTPVPCSARRE